MGMSSSKNKKKENEKKLEKEKTEKKENKDNKKGKDNVKKIKNILSDKTPKGNNDFDVLFIIDATGSMASYIQAAKEETQNISEDLRQTYPEMKFKYGYIFYRDPIDSKTDIHETIDLTDNANSLPSQISKIKAEGGGDTPEDWVGAYKIANEKISWRNGVRIIIHLADAGAHGKLFTSNDKYPEEEKKLINELEKCVEKKIDIFGYVILEESRKSFEECSKIYRNKGGSYEILNFFQNNMANYASESYRGMRSRKGKTEDFQTKVNRNFRMNAVRNVADRMKRREEEFK
jgi:Mg-chelatase subunit ChlD